MELNLREADIAAIFDKGLQAQIAGDLSAAEQLYQETLVIKPEHPEANHNIGVVLVAKNELNKALEFFKFALDHSPNVSIFWASYIDTLIKLERIGESKTLIKAVKQAGISCDKIEAISLKLNILYQEPGAKVSEECDELIEQQKFEDAIKICMSLTETYPSSAILNINLGKCYFEIGQIEQAISSYKKATEYQPQWELGFALLGQIYSSQGNVDAAIEGYKKALLLNPDYAECYVHMGIALGQQGKPKEAIEAYNKVLTIKPDYVDAYYNLGVILEEQGKLEEAIKSYKQALKIKPDYAEIYYNMGNAQKGKGDLDEAIKSYKQAIRINSDYAEAYNNMGVALKDKSNRDAAIDSYKQALKIKPDYAEAYSNMGVALQDKGDQDAAIDSYKQAIKIDPDNAEAYINMGKPMQEKSDQDAAIDSYKRALKIKPDYAAAYSNMGVALQDKGDRDAAIDSYKQAIKIDPDNAKAHQNLGLLFLNTGRLKEGLDENEWRWRNTDNLLDERHFSLPLWDGISSLEDKTILVWGEQGPGDMIIWSSCVEKLSSISGHCILECSEKLFSLFARSFPDVEVKIANSSLDAERDDFDFHLPMGSLFRHFIDEISTDHITKAYLVPDPDRVNLWRERLNVLGVGPFVGISWKSPLMTSTRRPNYTEISDWAPLFSNTSINFINLQSTDFADDLTAIQDKFGIKVHNFDDLDHYNDLDNVAALSAALDAVVSVATAVPTLTAAVGTPTKLASWRQSPWNNILFTPVGPHFDVFERNTWDSWSNVFHSIADDILSYKIIRREI